MTTFYEKPKMKKVSLTGDKAVANTCWGYHGKGVNQYCDTKGPGWFSFQIAAGDCELNLINIVYYTDTNQNGMADGEDQGIPVSYGSDRYYELYNILLASGGSDGNPYHGEGITTHNTPQPDWS